MTKRKAEFADGPLDGVTFEVPSELDMVVMIFRDRAIRYEVDQEKIITVQEDNEEPYCLQTYRLVETRDQEEFDNELIIELGSGDLDSGDG